MEATWISVFEGNPNVLAFCFFKAGNLIKHGRYNNFITIKCVTLFLSIFARESLHIFNNHILSEYEI